MEWWVYLLVTVIIGFFWYLAKGRKKQEKPIKMTEPGEIEVEKPSTSKEIQVPIEKSEIKWSNIYTLIGIICLLIISITFVWGVSNSKFGSFASFSCPECKCPDIEIPDCSCPAYNFSCICPNVSIDYFPPNINIYINQTNSSG